MDALLREDALICLQELSFARMLELRRRFGKRVFVAPVMFGWEYLAVVLPTDASFVAYRTFQLNSRFGLIPALWSLKRARMLRRAGRRSWRDCLTLRAAQVCHVVWRGREFRLVHTHLPYEPGLRDRCLTTVAGLLPGSDAALLCGDLNATTADVHLADGLLSGGLRPAGDESSTLGRRRIDFVAYRGGFREARYRLTEGRSDHRLVGVELEVD